MGLAAAPVVWFGTQGIIKILKQLKVRKCHIPDRFTVILRKNENEWEFQ